MVADDNKKSEKRSNSNETTPNSSQNTNILLTIADGVNQNIIQPITHMLPFGPVPTTYFTPYLTHHNVIINPNYNYITNQGIFIPEATENNQYYFIPGNIFSDMNGNMVALSSIEEISFKAINDPSESTGPSILDASGQPMVFIPKLSNETQVDENYDDENYETLIMPVKIKKEDDGKIELVPEENYDPHLTSPEQWNIMKKICIMKNAKQNVEKDTSEKSSSKKTIPNSALPNENREAITNLKDNTKGYVMVKLSRVSTKHDIDDIKSAPVHNKNTLSRSLMLSASDSINSRNAVSLNGMTTKRRINRIRKSKLQLSDRTKIQEKTKVTKSRFRRLRKDDVKQIWVLDNISCTDTKVKELPPHILELCSSATIHVPIDVNFIPKQSIRRNATANIQCGHEHLTAKPKPKTEWFFWKYMCSMNNCEFLKFTHKIGNLKSL